MSWTRYILLVISHPREVLLLVVKVVLIKLMKLLVTENDEDEVNVKIVMNIAMR